MGDYLSLNGRHSDVNAQRIGCLIKYIYRLYGSGHIYGLAKPELIVFLNVLIRVTCLQQPTGGHSSRDVFRKRHQHNTRQC